MILVRYLDLRKIGEEEYERFLARCDAARREKVLRFVHQKDRLRALFSHALLPHALAESGRDPALAGNLSYNAHGKPYLPATDGFCFNLSHAGDFVVIAVSPVEVGVDIERIRGDRRKISERFFGEQEKAYIRAAKDEKEAEQRFTRVWTLKESYMKMTGEGFHLSPSDFRIGIGEEDIFLEREGIYEACHFAELSLLPSYCCSVCTEGTLPETNVKSLDLRSVIRQLAKNRQKTDR